MVSVQITMAADLLSGVLDLQERFGVFLCPYPSDKERCFCRIFPKNRKDRHHVFRVLVHVEHQGYLFLIILAFVDRRTCDFHAF